MVGSFDTLDAARRLKDAGAAEPLAEAIAGILRQSRDFDLSQLATKSDLDQFRQSTKMDIDQLRQSTKMDIEQLRQSMNMDIEQLRQSMTMDIEQLRSATKADIAELKVDVLKWVVGLMIAQSAVIVALVKLLLGHG